MRWQDLVISICQIGFVAALIPSIKSHHKPPAVTSGMNSVLVCIITICLLTLRLWFSAITAFMIAVAWLILAVQKVKANSALNIKTSKTKT